MESIKKGKSISNILDYKQLVKEIHFIKISKI